MQYAYLMLFFFGATCAIGVAQAAAGYARRAGGTDLGYGIRIPDESDPENWEKAHSALTFWGTLSAILSLPPLIALGGGQVGLAVSAKVLLTLYGLALTGVVWYPFVAIGRLSGRR